MDKETVNTVTNVAGSVLGAPELTQGIMQLIIGDYIGGGLLVVKGLALIIGFYVVGKV